MQFNINFMKIMWFSVRMLSHAGKANISKITWCLVVYIYILKIKQCLNPNNLDLFMRILDKEYRRIKSIQGLMTIVGVGSTSLLVVG